MQSKNQDTWEPHLDKQLEQLADTDALDLIGAVNLSVVYLPFTPILVCVTRFKSAKAIINLWFSK